MTVSATPTNTALLKTGSVIMLVTLGFPLTGLVLLSVFVIDFLVGRLKSVKRVLS